MRRVFIFVFAGMTLSVCAQALREDSLLEKDGSDGLPEWNDQEHWRLVIMFLAQV